MTYRTRYFSALALLLATAGAAGAQGFRFPPPPPAPEGLPSGASRPPSSGLMVERDVDYAPAQHLDLYRRPASDGRALPVVLWIHGRDAGAWGKAPTPATRLIAHGYAVASIETGMPGKGGLPAALDDAKAAVRWLRANAARFNLDAGHIGVWGDGWGGTVATLLGVGAAEDSGVQAAVDFFGPMDAAVMERVNAEAKPGRSAPLLIVQGTADTAMVPSQSEKLQLALMRAGVENDLDYIPGAGHSTQQVQTPAIAEKITLFFDKYLRGNQHQREDLAAIRQPADAWIDAFSDSDAVTQTQLYLTRSRGAGTQGSYRLYLPPGYNLPANRARRYPVIYFLHGFTDDSREALTSGYIARIDAAMRARIMPEAIVIAVQSPNTASYADSPDGKVPAESAFIKDLIPAVDARWRTIPTRAGRAIDGHSMGGTGALRLGFKYPDLFGAVEAISPAMTAPGGGGLMVEEADSPWGNAARNAARLRGRTFIQLIEGSDDGGPRGGLLRVQWMDKVLEQYQIPHSFLMSPGAKHPVRDELSRLESNPFTFYARAFGKVSGGR